MKSSTLTNSLPVIPAPMITVLSKNLYRRLRSIHFQLGHVQVIYKYDKVLAKWRTKHPFTPKKR